MKNMMGKSTEKETVFRKCRQRGQNVDLKADLKCELQQRTLGGSSASFQCKTQSFVEHFEA